LTEKRVKTHRKKKNRRKRHFRRIEQRRHLLGKKKLEGRDPSRNRKRNTLRPIRTKTFQQLKKGRAKKERTR